MFPRTVNNFRTEHLGGYFGDFWSPYVAEAKRLSKLCGPHPYKLFWNLWPTGYLYICVGLYTYYTMMNHINYPAHFYICKFICIYIHISINTYLNIFWGYMYTYTYIYIYIQESTNVCIVYLYLFLYIYIYIYIYVYM